MKIRRIIGSAAFAASLTCSGAWAWDQDPAAQYFERKDTIVSGAGDARDVNAATQIIDPWPRYVGNRQIPGNGQRMTGAANAIARTHRGPRLARLRRHMISRPEAYVLMRPGVAPTIESKVRAVGLLAASVGLLAASVGLLAVDAKASPVHKRSALC